MQEIYSSIIVENTMRTSTKKLSPEQSGWGWKLLIVACVLSFIFMSFFYLAISNDPEYMPSHKQNYTQQTFETAPTMQPQQVEQGKTEMLPMHMNESEHQQH